MSRMRPVLAAVLLLGVMTAFQLHEVNAYPSGAPSFTCDSMTPSHGASSQPVSLAGPNGGFTITPSVTSYQLGTTYTMTIAGGTNPFRGFLCEARDPSGAQLQVFTGGVPAGVQQVSGCTDAYTHTSKVDKTSVTFNWRVTSASVTSFRFICTFVQVKTTFYEKVPTAYLSLVSPTTPAPSTAPTPSTAPFTGTTASGMTNAPTTPAPTTPAPTTPQAITSAPATTLPGGGSTQPSLGSGCGSVKSCYRSPSSCSGPADCTYFYSQRPVGTDKVEIELSAKSDGWVAVGFSNDRTMGDDDVMGCNVAADGSTVYIKNTNNVGKSNAIDSSGTPDVNLMNGTMSYVNGQLSCNFTRLLNTNSGKDKDFSGNKKYYLFFGTNTGTGGRGVDSIGLPSKHNKLPPITGAQYSATDTSQANFAVSVKNALIKAHGFFMIVAWICLAGIGLFMPRFMKKAWAAPKDGIAYWFKFHRPLMVAVWLLSVIGIILIFIFADGKWNAQTAHPGFGLATFILCGIQPFMALIRTKLNPFQRKIFNWSHRTVGFAAHALGAIAVYLGMDLFRQNYGLSTAALYVWAAWAAIEGVIWIGHEVKLLISPADPTEKISSDSTIRVALLLVYSVSSVVLGLVMAIMVAVSSTQENDD